MACLGNEVMNYMMKEKCQYCKGLVQDKCCTEIMEKKQTRHIYYAYVGQLFSIRARRSCL